MVGVLKIFPFLHLLVLRLFLLSFLIEETFTAKYPYYL
jgi:hypothetical protein